MEVSNKKLKKKKLKISNLKAKEIDNFMEFQITEKDIVRKFIQTKNMLIKQADFEQFY